jgi:hypothetical protein
MVESSSSLAMSASSSDSAEDRRAQFFDEFYSLKQKYEEKKREMEKAGKRTVPLCVKCGNPGGTLFSIKNGRFIAICRASGKKCDLHMEMNRGNYYPTRDLIFKYQDILDRARENIIVMKNNLEFGYGKSKGGETNVYAKAFEEENAHYESARKRIEAMRASLGDAEREAEKRDVLRELGELRNNTAAHHHGDKNGQKQKQKQKRSRESEEEDTMEYIENYRDKVMPLVERLRNLREPYMIPPITNESVSVFQLTRVSL